MQTLRISLHGIARGLVLIAVTLLLAGAAGLVSLQLHGERLLSVQSDSMVPTFYRGDALLVMPTPFTQLHDGDIVSYQSRHDSRIIISHRITAVDRSRAELTTAGDALRSPDPNFSSKQIIGRAIAIAPRLGRGIDFLRTPLGLISVIYVPALLLIVDEIRSLLRVYASPYYQLQVAR